MRKRRLEEGVSAFLASLTMEVIKTVGKHRELECTSFPHTKKSLSINKTIDPNIVTRGNFAINLIPSPDNFLSQNSVYNFQHL